MLYSSDKQSELALTSIQCPEKHFAYLYQQQTTLCLKKHNEHFRLWLEHELSDFNNFW